MRLRSVREIGGVAPPAPVTPASRVHELARRSTELSFDAELLLNGPFHTYRHLDDPLEFCVTWAFLAFGIDAAGLGAVHLFTHRLLPPGVTVSVLLGPSLLLGAVAGVLGLIVAVKQAQAERAVQRAGRPAWLRHRTTAAALGRVAADLGVAITRHRAWNSPTLDAHRLRVDPREEVLQIVDRARELDQLRLELGPAPSTTVGGGTPAAWHRRNVDVLDQIEEALVARVAVLDRYLAQLDRVGDVLDAADSMERASATSIRLTDLAGDPGRDFPSGTGFIALSDELDAAVTGVQHWATSTSPAHPRPGAVPDLPAGDRGCQRRWSNLVKTRGAGPASRSEHTMHGLSGLAAEGRR